MSTSEQQSGPSQNHLNPSELGTKEYWDSLYNRELQNHASDKDDEGTIWFDESNAEATVIRELDLLAKEGLLDRGRATFLDLGTGNGHMLFALRESPEDDGEDDDDDESTDVRDGSVREGNAGSVRVWKGEMTGVDYSAPSIDLARRIAAQKEPSTTENLGILRFETWDLLIQPPSTCPGFPKDPEGFDVVLDKGTFDAISLMPPSAGQTRHPCRTYRENVSELLHKDGFLVLTSCNWTRQELVSWLSDSDLDKGDVGFEFVREAKYPSFTFGGKTGQSIVTVVFRQTR